MFGPLGLFSMGMEFATLASEAQMVIALRLARFAQGHSSSGTEAMRMVAEKAEAFGEAGFRVAAATAQGRPDRAPEEVLKLYRKRVRANRRRLSR